MGLKRKKKKNSKRSREVTQRTLKRNRMRSNIIERSERGDKGIAEAINCPLEQILKGLKER